MKYSRIPLQTDKAYVYSAGQSYRENCSCLAIVQLLSVNLLLMWLVYVGNGELFCYYDCLQDVMSALITNLGSHFMLLQQHCLRWVLVRQDSLWHLLLYSLRIYLLEVCWCVYTLQSASRRLLVLYVTVVIVLFSFVSIFFRSASKQHPCSCAVGQELVSIFWLSKSDDRDMKPASSRVHTVFCVTPPDLQIFLPIHGCQCRWWEAFAIRFGDRYSQQSVVVHLSNSTCIAHILYISGTTM